MRSWRKRASAVLREPLFQFAAASLALFAFYGIVAETAEEGGGTIVVDRRALLTYMQYRANAFQSEYFSRQFDEIPADERQRLAREYARTEALYREAQVLELAQGDYVIRQRMIQKIQYLLGDFAAARAQASNEEPAAYLEAHAADYAVAASYTFTHVYFDSAVGGEEQARKRARHTLAALRDSGDGFNDAGKRGDRFPFFRHYVERTPDYIESHFGAAFVTELGQLEPSAQAWQGPISSEHGVHLVMLTQSLPKRAPDLDEIRVRVEEDLQRERAAAALEAAIDEVVDTYVIEFADDLEP